MVNAYWDYHVDFIASHSDDLEGTRAGTGRFIVATVVLCIMSTHATRQELTLSGYCNCCQLEPKTASPAMSHAVPLGSAD